MKVRTLIERFWEKVEVRPGTCWEWKGYKDRSGYGSIYRCPPARRVRAHRLSLELAIGKEIPNDLFVCHHCDNPSCCNPDHLFVGTQKDNIQDMLLKERDGFTGDKHWKSILDPDAVREIRAALKRGEPQKEIGSRYGVTFSTISGIKQGRTWRRVQ